MDNLETLLPFLYVFCTLFAACVGSFSNVVIYRVPNHLNIAWPPSSCPKCKARIKPYDNIPVLSWLILRGKCRNCKNPISVQYPIIEGICALFGFFLCRQVFDANLSLLAVDGAFWRLLVLFASQTIFLVGALALAVIDYQTTEIPHEIALPIGALGILVAFVLPDSAPYAHILGNIDGIDAILGAVIGGGTVLAIIGLYYLATRRIGMGGGDIWMMAMVGGFLGWECLPFIFLAASVQGILAAIIGILLGKKQQTETENGLFRNRVANELEAEIHAEKSAETAKDDDAPSDLTPSVAVGDISPSPQKRGGEGDDAADAGDAKAVDTADAGDAKAADTAKEGDENDDELEPSTGKLAIPFGPFIALGAIEYVFFGKFLLPIVSGGVLTPWGFVVF